MSIPKNCFECKHRKIEQRYINGTWRTSTPYIGIKGKALTMVECELLDKRLAGDFKNVRPISCPLRDQEKRKEYIDIDSLNLFYNKLKELYSNEQSNLPSNCKNCGAPLTSNQCEYCGTRY